MPHAVLYANLLRRLKAEKWTFERSTWHFDGTEGVAVYQAQGQSGPTP